jgi:hypothetical protein
LRINSILPIKISQKVYTAQFGQTQFLPQSNGARYELCEINYSANHGQIRLVILSRAQESGILDPCMSNDNLEEWKNSIWVLDNE